MQLTEPQRRALVAVAHTGQAYYSNETRIRNEDVLVYHQCADRLEQLGLITIDPRRSRVHITDAGRAEADRIKAAVS